MDGHCFCWRGFISIGKTGRWQRWKLRLLLTVACIVWFLGLSNIFLPSSAEAIWQLIPVSTGINTSEGNLFIPIFSFFRPTFAATAFLLNAFEINDQRKTSWLGSSVIGGQPYFYPLKYKVRTGGPPYTEYYMVVRLAELYLIRAEARAHQDNITAAQGGCK